MTGELLPDAEAIAFEVLDGEGLSAHGRIPDSPTWPLLTVQRLGGIPAERHWLDTARIQVSAWGGDDRDTARAEARDLADAARAALHGAEGTAVASAGAFVTGVEDDLGLAYLPDPQTGRDRYVFAVRLYAHRLTT